MMSSLRSSLIRGRHIHQELESYFAFTRENIVDEESQRVAYARPEQGNFPPGHLDSDISSIPSLNRLIIDPVNRNQ